MHGPPRLVNLCPAPIISATATAPITGRAPNCDSSIGINETIIGGTGEGGANDT